ncbi:MAG: phosphonoacetaldehyde reductase [Eubacterium sp.]
MSVILDNYTDIDEVFERYGVQRPFLCCGKSFQKSEAFEYIKKFNPVIFDHIRPNPRFEDMIDGAELFNRESCDFLIAAGGGSPMDSAKMIRLMTTNDIATCLEQPMKNNDIKTLFIPTTAGTGAEATKSSVFYVNEVDKLSIANYDFIPDYVILDEKLLFTVPDYQRKCTCLDALCHAIESFWSTKAIDESREYAAKAIQLFMENKDDYMSNTQSGNRGMLMASYYGGKAINITGTTAAHAMCYNITMNCGTAHGHSVAACLVEIWRYMLEHNDRVNDPMGREHTLDTFAQLEDMMGGLTDFERMVKDEFALAAPRIDAGRIPGFVSKVNVSRLGNNPTVLEADDVAEIYNRILVE